MSHNNGQPVHPPIHRSRWQQNTECRSSLGSRLTDEQVALEYENLMERFPAADREYMARSNACFVRVARRTYPNINSGLDLMAWVDEEDYDG